MRSFLFIGVLLALAGCARDDASPDLQTLWGPCRQVALDRAADVRAAGYDAEQQRTTLRWTYDDCVASDRRTRLRSAYDGPAQSVPPSGRPAASALR